MHGVKVAELGEGTVGVDAAEGLDLGFDDLLDILDGFRVGG